LTANGREWTRMRGWDLTANEGMGFDREWTRMDANVGTGFDREWRRMDARSFAVGSVLIPIHARSIALWRAMKAGYSLLAGTATAMVAGSDPQFAKDIFRGAKPGECALDQVDPNKNGQQQPPRAHPVRERDTHQDHGSRQDSNGIFHFHIVCLQHGDGGEEKVTSGEIGIGDPAIGVGSWELGARAGDRRSEIGGRFELTRGGSWEACTHYRVNRRTLARRRAAKGLRGEVSTRTSATSRHRLSRTL
jgi:hypothetical protein